MKIDDWEFEKLKQFTYLDSIIKGENHFEREIEHRLANEYIYIMF